MTARPKKQDLPTPTGLWNMAARLWRQLNTCRRRQFLLLMGLVLVSAMGEVVTLGAVIPFLGVLAAPELMFKYAAVARMMVFWGVTSVSSLVLPFALGFASAALVAGALRVAVLGVSTRLAHAAAADVSSEVYRRTLYQPYHVQLAVHSSELITRITGKVGDAVMILSQLLVLLNAGVLLVFLTLALFVINPAVAAGATAGFGGAYVLIAWATRRRLHLSSERIGRQSTQVVRALQEGLGGIRDVLLDGTQSQYCENYRRADQVLRRAQGDVAFFNGAPRFVMEAFGMVLIAGVAYAITRQTGDLSKALPMLGVLALGAQRLLPTLQQAYGAWSNIAGRHDALIGILEFLERPLPPEASLPVPEPLPFRRDLRFESVRFRYTSEGPWVLDGFDLTIRKGLRVGIVGRTGCGKSTALDLLMGLLQPTQGAILVDGVALADTNVRAWQRSIAHVPQSIYLADTSLAENIAFGTPRDEIDIQRVRQAARQAQIAKFIESRPEGYAARVGERGIHLSGGQRQGIGIARALYKQASVLVFDEATRGLDNVTEESVITALDGLDRELTIIQIAHLVTSLRHCDLIVEIDHGRVAAPGPAETPALVNAGRALPVSSC